MPQSVAIARHSQGGWGTIDAEMHAAAQWYVVAPTNLPVLGKDHQAVHEGGFSRELPGESLLLVAIQVKTKGEHSGVFQLRGVVDPSPEGANEWVVLVALTGKDTADYFVVPRNHVCAAVIAVLDDKPKNQRGGLGVQVFEGYRNDWELMETRAQDVEWRVQSWVYEIAARITSGSDVAKSAAIAQCACPARSG